LHYLGDLLPAGAAASMVCALAFQAGILRAGCRGG